MSGDSLIFWGTIPWVILFFVVLYYYNKNGDEIKRIKSLFYIVFLYAAIRYGIGYDYFTCKEIVSGVGETYQLERWEILARYIAIYTGPIHYQLFFAICSFLTIYPIYYVSKKISPNPVIPFVIFVLFPVFFLNSLSVVRNGVAYSMVLLMFYFVLRNKIKLSLIFYVVAICFHVSAIFAIIIYPFFYFPQSKKTHLIIYVLSLGMSAFLIPLLQAYFSDIFLVEKFFTNIDKEIKGGVFMNYVINFFAIVNFIYWKKLSYISSLNKFFLSIINAGICLWNIFIPLDQTTAQRLSTFFLMYNLFLFPFYKKVMPDVIYKIIFCMVAGLFVISLGLNLYAYYELHIYMSNIPYQVFFLNPSDYFYHSN